MVLAHGVMEDQLDPPRTPEKRSDHAAQTACVVFDSACPGDASHAQTRRQRIMPVRLGKYPHADLAEVG
jgi:hypothetical protein